MKPNRLLLLPLLLAFAACHKGPAPEDTQKAAKASAQRLAYERVIKDWRAQRVQRLTKPDGWLSLVGMHWLGRPDARGFGP